MLHISQVRNVNFAQEIKLLTFVLMIVVVCAGCRNMERSEDKHIGKYDAPLRTLIADHEENNPDNVIHVLIQLVTAPDENLSKYFRDSDIEVMAISGNILAARGKASDIRKIAGSDEVVSISLSEERGLQRR